MTQTVVAVYEDGVLRPTRPLAGIVEHARVKVTVETDGSQAHPLDDCIGILPNADALEVRRIIDDEFEKALPTAGRRAGRSRATCERQGEH